MENSEKHRLFVAVDLPDLVRTHMSHIQAEIKRSRLCEGRYPDALQAHLTLVFVGPVAMPDRADITAALKKISFPVLKAELGTLGYFQKHGTIRIIYLEIICPLLATLAQTIQDDLSSWLIPEKRPFVSHATLMRVTAVCNNDQLLSLLHRIPVQPHTFVIDSFILMESELTPQGPLYHELARYPLVQ